MTGERFPSVFAERWALDRLRARALFCGVTTAEQRRERLRDLLRGRNLGDVWAAGRGRKAETWGGVFRRLYGVNL